jgi:hypothetical protein
MELVSDVGRVESHCSPFGDSVSVSARLEHGLTQQTIGIEIVLDEIDPTPR